MKLDKIDRLILQQLQDNARLPNVDLANKVGLSPSACSRSPSGDWGLPSSAVLRIGRSSSPS